ncbi:MAG: hypothetical protein LWX83_19925 [Anaerolineae bacterium]|nr:hypothetical protein [Anaerolineae bacterium]
MMDEKNEQNLLIGRLLRASASGCVVGCKVSRINTPSLGGLVRIPLDDGRKNEIYGMIYDINIEDDGLVRQLITAENVDPHVIMDNRLNRNVPVEISVLFVGYSSDKQIFHLLPPRPPLTLDEIFLCSERDLCEFSSAGRFGYFRHILRATDLPVGELIANHIRQVNFAQIAGRNPNWASQAVQELITLLRDDYPTLMTVLSALADAHIYQEL